MYRSWTIRWLYPASSEPPPLDAPVEDFFIDDAKPMPEYPVWRPPPVSEFLEPIPNPDTPFVQSSWTMLMGTWFVHALYGTLEIEEVPDQFFLEQPKPMPEYPPWRPPDHPSYFNQDEEFPHPEIDRIDLPIWVPWRPIPEPVQFFTDEEEFVTPDKYERPWEIPYTIDWRQWWLPQPDEIIPDLEPYLDQPIVLPVQPPYFMPPSIPFQIDLGSQPPKCPPPCLRRPDKKC